MKLQFLGCGTKMKGKPNLWGNNSAFLKVQQPGSTNMLLLDCGGKTKEVIRQTGVLSGVDQLVLFITHGHPDHMNQAGYLIDACKKREINFGLMLSPFADSRAQVLDALERRKVKMGKIAEAKPHDVEAKMGLGLDFRLINHHGEAIQSTALVMKKHTIRDCCKTIYATDHNDERFIKEVIQDNQLEMLYTDCTEKDGKGNGSHLPFSRLCELVPDRDTRRKICLMHMTAGLPELGRRHGFLTADEMIIDPVLYKEKIRNYHHARLRNGSDLYDEKEDDFGYC